MGVKDASRMEYHHLEHRSSPPGAAKAGSCCHGAAGPSAHLAKDPVCGMDVDPATARHRAHHGGHTHYFCSAGCRAKFEADPAKYLGPAPAAAPPAPDGAIYTCPMHPEI